MAGPSIVNVGTINRTLYLQNLNERASLRLLKHDLLEKFGEFGDILQIVAKRSLKLRGQAFITFRAAESAKRAMDTLQGHPLFGKELVIRFAKYKSDIVSRADGTFAEEHAKIEKERHDRLINPPTQTRKQIIQQLMQASAAKGYAIPTAVPVGPSVNQIVTPAGMDDLNKTVFVQRIPNSAAKEHIEEMFSRYAGYIEVRWVPGRADLAFVDYDTEVRANAARLGLNDHKFSDSEPMLSVTFAKK